MFHRHTWKEINREILSTFIKDVDKFVPTDTLITYQCEKNITHHKQIELKGIQNE